MTENYGVVLESSSSAIYHSSRTNVSSGVHPYFSIVYVNSTGLESRFSYSDQDAGAAGAGSVNLFSGNLTFSFADASVANGALPISVSHVYNTNDKNTDIGYGYGWRLNYSQSIEEMSFQNGNKAQTFFKLTDGDGTRHYYKNNRIRQQNTSMSLTRIQRSPSTRVQTLSPFPIRAETNSFLNTAHTTAESKEGLPPLKMQTAIRSLLNTGIQLKKRSAHFCGKRKACLRLNLGATHSFRIQQQQQALVRNSARRFDGCLLLLRIQ